MGHSFINCRTRMSLRSIYAHKIGGSKKKTILPTGLVIDINSSSPTLMTKLKNLLAVTVIIEAWSILTALTASKASDRLLKSELEITTQCSDAGTFWKTCETYRNRPWTIANRFKISSITLGETVSITKSLPTTYRLKNRCRDSAACPTWNKRLLVMVTLAHLPERHLNLAQVIATLSYLHFTLQTCNNLKKIPLSQIRLTSTGKVGLRWESAPL